MEYTGTKEKTTKTKTAKFPNNNDVFENQIHSVPRGTKRTDIKPLIIINQVKKFEYIHGKSKEFFFASNINEALKLVKDCYGITTTPQHLKQVKYQLFN